MFNAELRLISRFSTLAPTTNLPGSADSMVIVMETGAVNDKEEDPAQDNCDGRSVESDSFTTAASSLSLVDICKICHCGSEVSRENSYAKIKKIHDNIYVPGW